MPDTTILVEFLLRGMAIGALTSMAAAFFRAGVSISMRIAGTLFFLSVIAYVINSSHYMHGQLGAYGLLPHLLSLGGTGFFWLFVVTLFEDRPISLRTLTPAVVLTAFGLVALATPMPLRRDMFVVHNIMEIALSLHALYVIYESWRGDLVEDRRRLRGPFLTVVALYTISLSIVEIGEDLGVSAWWYSLTGGALLAVFCLAGSVMFLQVRTAIFGAAAPRPAPSEAPRADPADRLTLEKLAEAMDKGAAWKDESLTIGSLAEKVGVPEHRLRRLINDNLGHRNFAAFVNTRRIEAAKATLADPAQSRTTVAAIAFDLGFGSLGPFNRAFKEATGKTPTQWRRDTLEKPSPNSETSL